MRLRAEDLVVTLGGLRALDGASMAVEAGETLAVLGPSGSGKSTLLRVLAGLQRPDAGRVLLDGEDVTAVPPHRRGVALMFQEHALFPHRDVGANVAFGLRMQGRGRAEAAARVEETLELVGLPGFERRRVETLSGGERQRVALARALAPAPRVLLLDEPLGSLDRQLHERLVGELAELFARLDVTVVHVTHDVGEAFALGDRVALMREGRIVRTAPPDDLWARPADEWQARFVGLANVEAAGDEVRVIRPEAVRVERAEDGGAVVLTAERTGAVVRLRVREDGGRELEAVVAGVDAPGRGDRVSVAVDPAGVVLVPRG